MSIFIYLLKVSIAITLFYLLYQWIFRRFTFFIFNRIYLIGSYVFPWILPFVSIPTGHAGQGTFTGSITIDWDQIAGMVQSGEVGVATGAVPDPLLLIAAAYFGIAFVRFFSVIRKYMVLRNCFKESKEVREHGIKWKLNSSIHSPFTVFRTVYLDEKSYSQKWSPVKMHEAVHARQLHSIDLLISEMVCSALWFHPVVFLFKRQMRENHEFLADEIARTSSDLLVRYLQSFSEALDRNFVPSFASHFKSSTFKRRIIMLTNKRSLNRKRWYYLLILPFILMMTLAFQQPAEKVLAGPKGPGIILKGTQQIPLIDEPEVIPSGFPLDQQYKDQVTFSFNKTAKHPISGELMTHQGIDLRAPAGSPVYAAGKGKVETSEFHEKYGKLVIIRHSNKYVTLYAHLADLNVKAGDLVNAGQEIGTVGSTGLSTGPHLHYEVRMDGKNVNPADYY